MTIMKKFGTTAVAALFLTVGGAQITLAAPPDPGVPSVAEIDQTLDELRWNKAGIEDELVSDQNALLAPTEAIGYALEHGDTSLLATAQSQLADATSDVAETEAELAELCDEIEMWEGSRESSKMFADDDIELGVLDDVVAVAVEDGEAAREEIVDWLSIWETVELVVLPWLIPIEAK